MSMRPTNDSDFFEQEAANEARALIDRVSHRGPDPLKPLPLLSLESLRIVLTMDGRFPLIRYDENRNARIGAGGYVVIGLAMVLVISIGVGVGRALS